MKDLATVLLPATMDTKGIEAEYIAKCLREAGVKVMLMDVGIREEAKIPVHITRHEVAKAAGRTLEEVRKLQPEGVALGAMTEGAIELARKLYEENKIDGVISIGGSMGTSIASAIMHCFPLGFPKVMISTMATLNPIKYVGTKDIFMLNSVADISGLNVITEQVLKNGALAIAGMVNNRRTPIKRKKPLVLLTTLGTTEPTAKAVQRAIEKKGNSLILFHSNGMGGSAMEDFAVNEKIAAVVDMSLHEIMDHNYGGMLDAGPERGAAALKKGIPTILVPGNTDYLVVEPIEIAQQKWSGRRYHKHNAQIACVRTHPSELYALGKRVAELANNAAGPVAVLIPMKGFSAFDNVLGPLYDPEGPPAFRSGLKEVINSRIPTKELDCHILDTEFAAAIVEMIGEVAGL